MFIFNKIYEYLILKQQCVSLMWVYEFLILLLVWKEILKNRIYFVLHHYISLFLVKVTFLVFTKLFYVFTVFYLTILIIFIQIEKLWGGPVTLLTHSTYLVIRVVLSWVHSSKCVIGMCFKVAQDQPCLQALVKFSRLHSFVH